MQKTDLSLRSLRSLRLFWDPQDEQKFYCSNKSSPRSVKAWKSSNALRAPRTGEATHEQEQPRGKQIRHARSRSFLTSPAARLCGSPRYHGFHEASTKSLPDARFLAPGELIDLTAMVKLKTDGKTLLVYFIGPKSGGVEVNFEGEEITVITPQSPLVNKISSAKKPARAGPPNPAVRR